jgi:hypothetical protein
MEVKEGGVNLKFIISWQRKSFAKPAIRGMPIFVQKDDNA